MLEDSPSTLFHPCQAMARPPGRLHQSLLLPGVGWIRKDRLWHFGDEFVVPGQWLRALHHQLIKAHLCLPSEELRLFC